jgi:isoquinoline 1-oxidoreductase subunit beta
MNSEGHAMTDRRSFLVGAAAAGLSLGFRIPFGGEALASEGPEINAWVVVEPDDRVVIRIARSELGQGSLTGLAQLVAEELECDWSKVTTEFPTPGQNLARKRVWGDMMTGGSRGIRTSHDYVRRGGAAARTMLIAAAANAWNVPASECRAADSVITHHPSWRRVSFGAVAAAAAKIDPPKDVALKNPKDWKLAGTSVKRLDTAGKVNGQTMFGIDVRLPGLLCAAIKDCPVFGGKVRSVGAAAVQGMKGVRKVVPVGDSAVAVIGDTWWQAKTALDKLPIVWDEGPNATVSQASIDRFLQEGLTAEQAIVGNQNGDVTAALAGAVRTVEAVYGYPYQTNAAMEPMNATALFTSDRCEVWCPTQSAESALAAVVRTSGLARDKCDVHKTFVGSAFGRRSRNDDVVQAVRIAKQMPGTPIKLIWSREEDIQHSGYHPITQCKLTGGFDAGGNLIALHIRISGQSIMAASGRLDHGKDPIVFQGLTASGESAIGYTIPNLLVDHAMRNPHVPPGYWRGVNIHQNAIYLECFVDELAHAAGQDPLAFRRKLMANHPKQRAVLDAVAERAGWGTPAAPGVFRGLAQFTAYDSHIAACAEVSIGGDGKLKIHRIVAATDPGYAVNPAQIERQIKGSIVYGLSGLIYGGCTVKDGRIEQSNFHDYDSMRMAVMPNVESIIMPSGGFWGGVGEPTTCIAAPAVLNAIFAATGKRYRTVPLRSHGITLA